MLERTIEAGVLRIAYREYGADRDQPVLLLHGFPYDVHAYAEVAPRLAAAGRRVIVPYLRGYGPTRFLSATTPRSGQQAALAHDLLALLDALGIERATLAGYDWGGRAACIVAALWPHRVSGLISGGGYNIQFIASAGEPLRPADEHRYWYQYYLHSDRGRAGLVRHRDEFCRLLWRLWSPSWRFDDDDFARSAAAFANPDFIDVVVHSYRHRYGFAADDPAYADTERRLAQRPTIEIPTIVLDGADDGVELEGGSAGHAPHFGAVYERRVLPGVGHNLPQEAPLAFCEAVLALAKQ